MRAPVRDIVADGRSHPPDLGGVAPSRVIDGLSRTGPRGHCVVPSAAPRATQRSCGESSQTPSIQSLVEIAPRLLSERRKRYSLA